MSPQAAAATAGGLIVGSIIWWFLRHFTPAEHSRAGALLIQFGFTALLVSLIRISDRDPTSSELGFQAIFEFALQGLAGALIVLGVLLTRSRISLSLPLFLWIAVGSLAMLSAFWAPQPQFTAIKGLQLIAVCSLASVAALQFNDRYQAVRFLAWLTVFILVGAFLYQMMADGLDSIWEIRRGRFRMLLMHVHPLILGGFTGAVAVLMLVHRPRSYDWIAFTILAAMPALTSARVPLVLVVFSIVCYATLRRSTMLKIHLVWVIGVTAFIVAIVFSLLAEEPADTETSASLTFGDVQRDISTLNGRIPLWQAALERASSETNNDLNLVVGYGYASFRHFGTEQFSYAGDAHNAMIQVFAELGTVGVVLWLFAVGACARQIWRSVSGKRAQLIAILPFIYILSIQFLDASLADSRSFLLVVLLFYAHIGLAGEDQPDPSPAAEATSHRQIRHGQEQGTA